MRRAAKVDANHGEIIKALRQCGWLVIDTHAMPSGFDCIGWHPGRERVCLIEIKSTPKSRFTPAQMAMQDEGWPIYILRSVDDAIALR